MVVRMFGKRWERSVMLLLVDTCVWHVMRNVIGIHG